MENKELALQQEIAPVTEQVNALEIANASDMSSATSLLSQVNKYLDGLTTEKEKLTKPINEALKEIRARYKPTELILEESIAILKKKMGTYQQLALAEQKKAEAKITQALLDGKIKKVETAVRKMAEVEAPEAKVTTEDGGVSFRTVRKFEVVDMTLLPMPYHSFDNLAIMQAMKDGVELPGVRYFEEQQVINRRN